MARSLPVLAGTFAIAAAQSTSVISFMVPDWDGLHLSASVVDVKDDATTLAVRCEGVHLDWNMCGSNPQTIIGGPSTLSVSWVDPSAHLYDDVFYTKSQDLHCDIYLDQSTATCTSTAIDVIKGRRTTHVTTETTSRPDLYYYEVIATAGIEKLMRTDVETTELEASSKASATSEQVVVTDVATPSKARTNTTSHSISTPGSGANPTSPIIVDNAASARSVQNIVAVGLAAGVCGAAMLL
ncbi:hypothetical protein NM208_g3374 [Fusarium decemcellulare]|uniref:Uncharacterized protein n=1 Tax=Fusarium decemcellulare TaxID=57161 RepID=A0ACC1SPG3_9HYPO|nr:hypothetical protein NM208_g3374 [Fusarium decemcellulare]